MTGAQRSNRMLHQCLKQRYLKLSGSPPRIRKLSRLRVCNRIPKLQSLQRPISLSAQNKSRKFGICLWAYITRIYIKDGRAISRSNLYLYQCRGRLPMNPARIIHRGKVHDLVRHRRLPLQCLHHLSPRLAQIAVRVSRKHPVQVWRKSALILSKWPLQLQAQRKDPPQQVLRPHDQLHPQNHPRA